MPKIVLEIKDCSQCPFHVISGTYSTDGWDKMDEWFCSKENEIIRYGVEWGDKVPIPDWCPILLEK